MTASTTSRQPDNGPMETGTQDQQYWERVEKFRAELIEQANGILNCREDAEDVVQESFCEVLYKDEKLDEAALGPLLRTINRRNALNRVRDKGRAVARIGRRQAHAPTRCFTTGGFSRIELRESVQKCLQTLPEQLREVVTMRYFQHLSYKEISERLQITPKVVGHMLSKAELALYSGLKLQLKAPQQPAPAPQPAPKS